MALPVTVDSLGDFVPNMQFGGPFQIGSKTYVVHGYLNTSFDQFIDVRMATDPTSSFSLIDDSFRDAADIIYSFWCVVSGTDIYIYAMAQNTDGLMYGIFDTTTDLFTTDLTSIDVVVDDLSVNNLFVSAGIRSDGDQIVLFSGDSEKLHGTDYARIDYRKEEGSGWGSAIAVDDGGALNYKYGTVVKAESDKMVFLYLSVDDQDYNVKTLTSGNTLSSVITITQTAIDDNKRAFGGGTYYLDGAVDKVRFAIFDSGNPDNQELSDYFINDDAWATGLSYGEDSVVITDDVQKSWMSPTMDGTVRYWMYIDTGNDINYSSSDDDAAYVADTEAIALTDCNGIFCNVIDRSGKKLAYVYGNASAIKYNEVNLVTTTPVSRSLIANQSARAGVLLAKITNQESTQVGLTQTLIANQEALEADITNTNISNQEAREGLNLIKVVDQESGQVLAILNISNQEATQVGITNTLIGNQEALTNLAKSRLPVLEANTNIEVTNISNQEAKELLTGVLVTNQEYIQAGLINTNISNQEAIASGISKVDIFNQEYLEELLTTKIVNQEALEAAIVNTSITNQEAIQLIVLTVVARQEAIEAGIVNTNISNQEYLQGIIDTVIANQEVTSGATAITNSLIINQEALTNIVSTEVIDQEAKELLEASIIVNQEAIQGTLAESKTTAQEALTAGIASIIIGNQESLEGVTLGKITDQEATEHLTDPEDTNHEAIQEGLSQTNIDNQEFIQAGIVQSKVDNQEALQKVIDVEGDTKQEAIQNILGVTISNQEAAGRMSQSLLAYAEFITKMNNLQGLNQESMSKIDSVFVFNQETLEYLLGSAAVSQETKQFLQVLNQTSIEAMMLIMNTNISVMEFLSNIVDILAHNQEALATGQVNQTEDSPIESTELLRVPLTKNIESGFLLKRAKILNKEAKQNIVGSEAAVLEALQNVLGNISVNQETLDLITGANTLVTEVLQNTGSGSSLQSNIEAITLVVEGIISNIEALTGAVAVSNTEDTPIESSQLLTTFKVSNMESLAQSIGAIGLVTESMNNITNAMSIVLESTEGIFTTQAPTIENVLLMQGNANINHEYTKLLQVGGNLAYEAVKAILANVIMNSEQLQALFTALDAQSEAQGSSVSVAKSEIIPIEALTSISVLNQGYVENIAAASRSLLIVTEVLRRVVRLEVATTEVLEKISHNLLSPQEIKGFVTIAEELNEEYIEHLSDQELSSFETLAGLVSVSEPNEESKQAILMLMIINKEAKLLVNTLVSGSWENNQQVLNDLAVHTEALTQLASSVSVENEALGQYIAGVIEAINIVLKNPDTLSFSLKSGNINNSLLLLAKVLASLVNY